MLGQRGGCVRSGCDLSNFFPRREVSGPQSKYAMTEGGAVFKVTQGPGKSSEIVDLEGKPLLDAKTGRMMDLEKFRRQRRQGNRISLWGRMSGTASREWIQADFTLFSLGWQNPGYELVLLGPLRTAGRL